MSTIEHPEIDELNAYVRDPQADDFRKLRMHLVNCQECRTQIDMLSNLQQNLYEIQSKQFQEALSSDENLSHTMNNQRIENYVDGSLNESDAQPVANLIDNNGMALKAAMHYASHSAQMKRQDNNADTFKQSETTGYANNDRVSGKGFVSNIQRLLTIRFPLWLAIPATAAFAGLLSLVLIPQIRPVSQEVVVAYQDNPVIQFKQSDIIPGIGFFSSANKVSKPYANITVQTLDNNRLQISWPKVDNAVSYTMQLKVFDKGQQILVDKKTTNEVQASFKRLSNDSGSRYIWKLSGETDKGDLFSTRGGFIIKSESD